MGYPQIKLNKVGVARILKGHLWLTLREVKDAPSIKENLEPGSLVSLFSEEGYFLGQAYFNPKVKYALKVLTRKEVPITKEFFVAKIKRALSLRQLIYPSENCFRLIFSEGDYLCGLIVDVYGKFVVAQIYTLGLERLKGEILPALRECLDPEGIVLKNDSAKRREEGLELYREVAYGKVSEPIYVEMDGLKFLIPIISGQKTGFFLDQREARRNLSSLAKDRTILDLYSYTGAFSLYGLKAGAKRAILVDRSLFALELAQEMAKLNGFQSKLLTIQEESLKYLRNSSYPADLIVADPPAFIKSQKDYESGVKLYESLYFSCLKQFTTQEGLLALFSCSHFLSGDQLRERIRKGLAKLGLRGRILKNLTQAPDHPINPFIKETLYLKGLLLYLGP